MAEAHRPRYRELGGKIFLLRGEPGSQLCRRPANSQKGRRNLIPPPLPQGPPQDNIGKIWTKSQNVMCLSFEIPFFLSDPQKYRSDSTFLPDIILKEYVREDLYMYTQRMSHPFWVKKSPSSSGTRSGPTKRPGKSRGGLDSARNSRKIMKNSSRIHAFGGKTLEIGAVRPNFRRESPRTRALRPETRRSA